MNFRPRLDYLELKTYVQRNLPKKVEQKILGKAAEDDDEEEDATLAPLTRPVTQPQPLAAGSVGGGSLDQSSASGISIPVPVPPLNTNLLTGTEDPPQLTASALRGISTARSDLSNGTGRGTTREAPIDRSLSRCLPP